EVRLNLADLTIKEWNRVTLQSLNIVTEVETDFVITFELERVDLQDHVAFSAGAATSPVIGRSVVRENGNWITISESASFGTTAAKGSELWIRAQYTPVSQIVNDPGTPDNTLPVGEPIKVVLSDLERNDWNSLRLPGNGIELKRNEDVWMVTELITVGSVDVLDLISAGAEPQVRNRTAVFLIDEQGVIRWRFMQNTQFNNEYLLRKRATFTTEDNTQITDTIFLVLYDDSDGLPGDFLELVELPLAGVQQGTFNRIDVSSWGALRPVFHIGVTSAFQNNPFALATDDGTFASGDEHTTSVYLTGTEEWVKLSSLEGETDGNLLLNVEYVKGTNLETRDQLPSEVQLIGNFPNPFNPTTTIHFSLPESSHVLVEVFDMMGRPVAKLQDAPLGAGVHQLEFNAATLASGTYLLRLQASGQVITSKMLLIK
ncbi:MAG: T9SS type A sorting domain-containing protein, partial [Balneolales bacterium]|nr:T9SS type A sorting domain-containing protein [Balneolales bacterium]